MSTPISPRSRRRVLHPVARTATSLFVVGAVAAAGCVGAVGATATPVAPAAYTSVPAAGLSVAATVTIDGTQYPNPLRMLDGTGVTDVAQWEGTRRAELLAAFRENVYGQPLPKPTKQTFDVRTSDDGDVTLKKVTIGITGPEGTGKFTLRLFVPKSQTPRGTFLMLPNTIAPVMVYATIALGAFIGAEATLSFLGVGLRDPVVSWGVMISEAQSYLRTSPHLLLFPGAFLVVTVLAFVLLGDAVRDAFDPKGRSCSTRPRTPAPTSRSRPATPHARPRPGAGPTSPARSSTPRWTSTSNSATAPGAGA